MEIKEVISHSIENSKYKVQFEQAATKGVLGFKIEVNNDDLEKAKEESCKLLQFALQKASLLYQSPAPATPAEVKS